MNCKEFEECVCDVIDHRVSNDQLEKVKEHLVRCPHCRYELSAMELTCETVRKRLARKSVPSDLYYRILHQTSGTTTSPWMSLRNLFGMNSFNPVVAFVIVAMIAVGVYSLFIPSQQIISEERNIIVQSLKNYQAVIGGAIQPQMEDDIDNVRNFLSKEVTFDVNVPKLTGCKKCSGVLTQFQGITLAHVVYKLGDKIIYIYQSPLQEALAGKTIGLPPNAIEEIRRSGWYTAQLSPTETIALWEYKSTLCAAVSSLDKEQLIAILQQESEH